MRRVIDPQMKIGEAHISQIKLDLSSRDEIPKILLGLQHIYCNRTVRRKVFAILRDVVPEKVDWNTGRLGMDLWKILVLGVLRLGCNWDYDKLREIANNHKTLRQMLGHGLVDVDYQYALQTIKDNVGLFTPEVLDRINDVVVKAGHKILGKKDGEDLKGKCDSFVVETKVHYPTDINLLLDAVGKVIILAARLSLKAGNWGGFRQKKHNMKKIKTLFHKTRNLKRYQSKDAHKQSQRDKQIVAAHQVYVDLAESFVERVKQTMNTHKDKKLVQEEELQQIEGYIKHAQRQIKQIRARVLRGEVIAHDEKVFSIFEEHTEWICKGKAGVTQELGVRVCILGDKYGFILNHQVMQKQTDDKVAVPIVKETKRMFPDLGSCSFDKGFYSRTNKAELQTVLDRVILPKKGKLSLIEKAVEGSEEFIRARHRHSVVESFINGLENHGLDRCPDHGINGFKRYVSLAVLGRNIQILGHTIQQKERKSQNRREKIRRSREIERLRPAA